MRKSGVYVEGNQVAIYVDGARRAFFDTNGVLKVDRLASLNEAVGPKKTSTIINGAVVLASILSPLTTTVTSEELLAQLVVPADSLSADGAFLQLDWCGYTAANANSKTFTIEFDSNDVYVGTTSVSSDFICGRSIIMRTGSGAQSMWSMVTSTGGSVVASAIQSAAGDETADINIDIKGHTPTNAGDLTWQAFTVTLFKP